MRNKILSLIGIVLSFCIVAFGQPARSSLLGLIAACAGMGLFFFSCPATASRKSRFWLFALWFGSVQLIQLSWMTSISFQGYYILAVYLVLAFLLGVQFGCLSLVMPPQQLLRTSHLFALAGFWVWMEWSRLFFICGFTWNPIGLALASHSYPMQCASLFGVYGLSFWVMLTNLYFYRMMLLRAFCLHWLAIALIPYFFGIATIAFHDGSKGKPFYSALVQTALLPSEKVPTHGRLREFISGDRQWMRILAFLKEKQRTAWDLIVLPEGAVPYSAESISYLYEDIKKMFTFSYGKEVIEKFPPLTPPFAERRWQKDEVVWGVSNLFICQAIANIYDAELIIGLDHEDRHSSKNYNAAFYFKPGNFPYERYDKQVLLPLAEYLPFEFLRPLTKSYGIHDFFSQGKKNIIVGEKVKISPSICYEETFPYLMRKGKEAELFVNITNDNYYPYSSLPEQHFQHARIRSVENGIGLIRACNTGVTAAIDHHGRVVDRLGSKEEGSEWQKGVLECQLNICTISTLYSFWGDRAILILGLILMLFSLSDRLNLKKKQGFGYFLEVKRMKKISKSNN